MMKVRQGQVAAGVTVVDGLNQTRLKKNVMLNAVKHLYRLIGVTTLNGASEMLPVVSMTFSVA
jgi:hypothetical protein